MENKNTLDLIKIQNFGTLKNNKNEESSNRLRENICKIPTDKEVALRIYEEHLKLRKTNNPIIKQIKRYE